MNLIDPITYLNLQSIVEQAAHVLNIRPPRLFVRPMRNASYRALSHQIHLSERLALGMQETDLRSVLAHEVRHAAQRREIVINAVQLAALPSVVWLLGGILAYWLALVTGRMGLPSAAFAVTVVATYVAFRVALRPWKRRAFAMELEADAFAREFTGKADAMESALRACAAFEDYHWVGPEGERRIQAEQQSLASTG